MRRYRLSRLARTDLDEIWLDLARKASIDIADRVIDDITERFPILAGMPGTGRLRDEIEPGLRSFPVDDYIVYYLKAKRAGIVISRVVHGRRDQQKAMKPKTKRRQ
jgi:toxin ParE1/3/4